MISFIVPAHNEEQLLATTLVALRAAAEALGQAFEILVVDDASTDRTAEIAREHGARVVAVSHRQIAATRNAGARAAEGEMFVFVDADTVVNERVVASAVRAMREGAVGGGCAIRFDGRLPLWGRAIQALALPLYRTLRLAAGCFLYCTRDAFQAVGGFDEAMFGAEEGVMSRALGRQGRFVVLRDYVSTSGRKLRSYSGREVLSLLLRFIVVGPKMLRQRAGLDIWYGERRPEVEVP
jgi:glycosyltransferase involved in cell wall biosynthesis